MPDALFDGLVLEFITITVGVAVVWVLGRAYVDRQRALPPSTADDEIRKALTEGVLTDAELVEMGLDPAEFREAPTTAIDKMVRDLERAPAGKNRLRLEAGLARLQQAAEQSGVTLLDVDISTPTASIKAGRISVTGGGRISIKSDGVSIEVGADSD